MKRRSLTSDEKQMWDHVTRNDVKLGDRPRQIPEMENSKTAIFMASKRRDSDERGFVMPSLPIGYDSSIAFPCGAYAGIDRNTADRFRKGELPIAGTIDLHGMSREKAHMALSAFIHKHYDQGSRCLLAITGKGASSSLGSRGILREMLPQWLSEPGLKPMVLACDVAKAKHGGSGAYYILLRRMRNV